MQSGGRPTLDSFAKVAEVKISAGLGVDSVSPHGSVVIAGAARLRTPPIRGHHAMRNAFLFCIRCAATVRPGKFHTSDKPLLHMYTVMGTKDAFSHMRPSETAICGRHAGRTDVQSLLSAVMHLFFARFS